MGEELSRAGELFIASWEGFRPTPYNDAAGHATIGYGHLISLGPVVRADLERVYVKGAKPGQVTRVQALELLHSDANAAMSAVRQHIKVALTQAQIDALISFGYNLGPGCVAQIAPVINSKPRRWRLLAFRRWHMRVAATLIQYDHAGDQVLPGLLRRRRAEACLFNSSKYTRASGNPYANS
ncbi:MAG: lysozyme [Patescibacteria group bacterium]|nr:lysozyme [Patescibacteria group bacterium]